MDNKKQKELKEKIARQIELELKDFTLRDLQAYYYDRRWDELVIEQTISEERLRYGRTLS